MDRICGMMALERLEWLDLSRNRIERIQNIYYLVALTTLYLSMPPTNR
jgi:Leucine-rich repeat (LRR) protein